VRTIGVPKQPASLSIKSQFKNGSTNTVKAHEDEGEPTQGSVVKEIKFVPEE
jgi:hypothetical protein